MSDVMVEKLTLSCHSCGATFRVPASAAGKSGKCPKCAAAFRVPASDESTRADGPTRHENAVEIQADGRLKFACSSCGKSLKAPAQAAGKRVRCPQCQAVELVPDAPDGFAERGQATSHIAEDLGTGDDFFGGLASGQDVTIQLAPMSSIGGAPAGGGTALADNAKAVAGAIGGLALLGGRFARGLIGCGVGVAVGIAIWFFVAKSAGIEVGYIAWALGGLAGLGMVIGYREPYPLGGVIAAAAALGGVFLAKWLVFANVVLPLVSAAVIDDDDPREMVAHYMAQRAVDSKHVPEDEETDAYDAEREKSDAAVAKMTDAQVTEKISEARVYLESALKDSPVSMLIMFGFRDLIFIALAMGTAYKLGSMGLPGG